MKALDETENDFDFRSLSDLDLVLMQSELRVAGYPEDDEFRNGLLVELGKRHKRTLEVSQAIDGLLQELDDRQAD